MADSHGGGGLSPTTKKIILGVVLFIFSPAILGIAIALIKSTFNGIGCELGSAAACAQANAPTAFGAMSPGAVYGPAQPAQSPPMVFGQQSVQPLASSGPPPGTAGDPSLAKFCPQPGSFVRQGNRWYLCP